MIATKMNRHGRIHPTTNTTAPVLAATTTVTPQMSLGTAALITIEAATTVVAAGAMTNTGAVATTTEATAALVTIEAVAMTTMAGAATTTVAAGGYDDRARGGYDDHGRGDYDQRGHGSYDDYGGKPGRSWVAGPDLNTGLAAVSHILALFLWILGPVLIYAITDDPFVKQNAANATNWQIMLTIYMIISFILIIVLVGILFVFMLIILDLVFILIATIKAADGEAWEYPLTPELL